MVLRPDNTTLRLDVEMRAYRRSYRSLVNRANDAFIWWISLFSPLSINNERRLYDWILYLPAKRSLVGRERQKKINSCTHPRLSVIGWEIANDFWMCVYIVNKYVHLSCSTQINKHKGKGGKTTSRAKMQRMQRTKRRKSFFPIFLRLTFFPSFISDISTAKAY